MRISLLLAACVVALAPSAAASTLFNLSYTAEGVSALLNLTTTNNGDGSYLVTGVTGTRNGVSVDGVVGPGASGFIYDNLLFPAATPIVNYYGILYSAGGVNYNLYSSNGYLEDHYSPGGSLVTAHNLAVSLSQTPEPAGFVLIATGLLGVGCLRRRR
jgi:hypothetical protein